MKKYELFQFTPLREGRRTPRQPPLSLLYFNSRPSARGDVVAQHVRRQIIISIHAPPRGATCITASSNSSSAFQFTPLREGRLCRGVRAPRPCHFNSRPSARGDRNGRYTAATVVISIHAPPRGATIMRGSSTRLPLFQFTPLREGRHAGVVVLGQRRDISIHAPPRGATLLRAHQRLDGLISIHAPPRGATIPVRTGRRGFAISIHAPPRGATRAFAVNGGRKIFQFTPLREGRRRKSRKPSRT